MRIRTKRVYEPAAESDGFRVLIDRLWPRGLSKEKARVDHWAKSIAASHELRRWYRHDPAKWDEFRRRHFGELDANPEGVHQLRDRMGKKTSTLLFGSKEDRLNNATALREYLAGGKSEASPASHL